MQARLGVSVLKRDRRYFQGPMQSTRWDDVIAIGAAGGRPDRHYLWVQIYSNGPKELLHADGSTRLDHALSPEEGPAVGGADNELRWQGRRWSVDRSDTDSARFPGGRTRGSANCETFYDQPSSGPFLSRYLADNPRAVRVTRVTEFLAFLYEVDPDPARRPHGYLARASPSASVAWAIEQAARRRRPDAETEAVPSRYRVHFVHPNGVAPAGLARVLLTVFHGR